MQERNSRREVTGIVVSDAMDKSCTILVETYKKHPLYGKNIKSSNKLMVHDENNEAKVGDKVLVMETRPLSKNKRFRLVKIIEKAVII